MLRFRQLAQPRKSQAAAAELVDSPAVWIAREAPRSQQTWARGSERRRCSGLGVGQRRSRGARRGEKIRRLEVDSYQPKRPFLRA